MAEEQKNSSAETVDAAASAAHTVKGAIKAGKAISGAAKGAAAGGPYGAVAGAVWAGRKHIGKIIAIIAILLLLPVLFLLMLPGLILAGWSMPFHQLILIRLSSTAKLLSWKTPMTSLLPSTPSWVRPWMM